MAAKKNSGELLKALNEKLKGEDWSGLYLLTGEEVFYKEFYLDKFITRYEQQPMADFNLQIFKEKTNAETILSAAENYPVMAESKLIVIRESGIFKNAVPAQEKAMWEQFFDNPPPYAAVVFDEPETDGRNGLLKKLKAKGIYAQFDFLEPVKMAQWVNAYLDKKGYRIDTEAVHGLLERAGEGMGPVHNEMDKLIDFCGERKRITGEDVDAVVPRNLQNRLFEMMDGMIAGKTDAVMGMLSDLKGLREEPVKLIAVLGGHIVSLTKTKILLKNGSYDVAGELGAAPFIARKYIAQANQLPLEQLQFMLAACLQADQAVKYGQMEKWNALEFLMVRLLKRR